MVRGANFIRKYIDFINQIAITGDFHPTKMISFPNYWVDKDGNYPKAFTIISEDDVIKGIWKTENPKKQEWGLWYVHSLAENNKKKTNNFFDLRIWPYHAISGTTGANFDSILMNAVNPYLDSKVSIIMKGLNPDTEQQGAFEADVPVEGDKETFKNTALLNWLNNAISNEGDILIGGEAKDICLAYTVYSILDYLPIEDHSRIVLLEDLMSPIYPELGEKFISDMKNIYKLRISKTTEYFK